MGLKFSEIQNAKSHSSNKGASLKNEKHQNAKTIPDTRDTAGKADRMQKQGK